MRIDDRIMQALRQAVAAAGGAKELAQRSGVSASNISRYLSGKVRSMTDDCWEKLRPELDLPIHHAEGTVTNTPELREFLLAAMSRRGVADYEPLCRIAGYDSVHTLRRLFAGELNWFPDLLSAVLDALGCDRDALPVPAREKELLNRGINGAVLVLVCLSCGACAYSLDLSDLVVFEGNSELHLLHNAE